MCDSGLKKILENHLHSLREDCEGWENMRADLSGAYLSGANLSGADLSRAYLYRADLSGANLSGAINLFVPLACPDTGSFIAYKKAGNSLIVKLEIPEDAHRSSATGRKCRCDKARVLEIQNLDGSKSGVTCVQSKFDPRFVYKVGCVVEEPDFCEDRFNECAPGIHFFITREEAVNYE